MARPKFYTDETKVRLAPKGKSRLQEDSDRRAIAMFLFDRGGVATIQEINFKFGFDISEKVRALVNAKWLEVVQ